MGLAAVVCTCVLALAVRPARAADVVVIEVASTTRPPIDNRHVDRVAELIGVLGLRGEPLRAAILASVSTPGTSPDAASFEELKRLVEEGMQDFYANRFPQAIDRLTRAGHALQAAIDLVGREEAAQEVIRQVIRTFPDRRPMLAQFAPEVVRFFDETRAQMNAAPKAALSLETAPVHCAVLLNGQPLGVSPLNGKQLYPGTYTLQLRCQGRLTRVRQVHLTAGRVSLRFDVEADLALRTDPVPWIVAGAHAQRAAAELGRQLAAQTVYLVERRGERFVVEMLRSEDGSVRARGTGDDVDTAVAALRATRDGGPGPGGGAPGGASWASDWAAWSALGVGAVAAGVGLVLVSGARDDADAALDQPSSADRASLRVDARNAGIPGVLMLTGGAGLALGGVTALAVPASRHRGIMHGPLFWTLAGLGLTAASTGVGALLLDRCSWQDHAMCPAVYGEHLGAAGPAPAALLTGGLAVLGTAIVLRLIE